MEVVGHEAEAEHVHLSGLGVVGDQVEEKDAVSIGAEGALAIVALLSNLKVEISGSEAGFFRL